MAKKPAAPAPAPLTPEEVAALTVAANDAGLAAEDRQAAIDALDANAAPADAA
jgi:hypothetical protein